VPELAPLFIQLVTTVLGLPLKSESPTAAQ